MANLFLIVLLFFYSGMAFSQLEAHGKKSTNPCKDMVEALGLPHYDTALDTIDYSVPYDEIAWPWKTDPQKNGRRVQAFKDLRMAKANVHPFIERIDDIELRLSSNEPITSFGWLDSYDETDTDVYAKDGYNTTDDAVFTTLTYIPEIRSCYLAATKITDAGLGALFYLPLLEKVVIRTCEPVTHPLPITDAGIELLSKHPSIKELSLRGLAISDKAIEALSKSPNLRSLNLESVPITDKSVESLSHTITLDFLELANVPITEGSFKVLAENPNQITWLSIIGDRLTDNGLQCLSSKENLRCLGLTFRVDKNNPEPKSLSPKAILILAAMKNLESFGMYGYDFSALPDEATLEAIRNLKVNWTSLEIPCDKIHPLLLRALCDIGPIENVYIFRWRQHHIFGLDGHLNYSRMMYYLKNRHYQGRTWNEVPSYYLELEKPYIDELYGRDWTTDEGLVIRGSLLRLDGDRVVFKMVGSGILVNAKLTKLSVADQEYVYQVTSYKGYDHSIKKFRK